MRYEITIRHLEPYTPEEEKEVRVGRDYPLRDQEYPRNRYSDRNFHETRVMQVELTKEEFDAVKKAVITIL